ncbi:hypothetical protein BC629DRAFT_230094 [Irpex lacteus]|nr:hypothetical protein BC629DRAFT_230094 [Irpex lacteus]
MAALSITHTGKSASHAAQALSDAASAGNDAATTAERIIVDVASVIIMISAFLGVKLAVYSYVNQVPEAVETLLKIKGFLVARGQHGHAIARRYLEQYKKIQEDVHRIATSRSMANDLKYRDFSVKWVWTRFKASKRANKEAHRLLEDVKLQATMVTGRETSQSDYEHMRLEELMGVRPGCVNVPSVEPRDLGGHTYHGTHLLIVLMWMYITMRFIQVARSRREFEARHECSG